MQYLLLPVAFVVAAAHYGKPPCQSDELSLSIAGTGGQLCAPKCGAGDVCPQDLPPGDVVKPRCALNVGSDKYCALTCYFGKCPDGAACKFSSGAIVGYCVYPSNTSSMALGATIIDKETEPMPVLAPISGANPAWNISGACESMCQPDPDYSRTSWCKHKDRRGCCVEVNPSWDNVPGWKHMTDFCDKLCMPDGPGKLAVCTPPAEFASLAAVDPLDAIDKFYEGHPSECSERIGDWDEAYCKSVLPSLVV